MAEMTIRLRSDPATGKKDIIISLRSDADAMPHEHEEQHHALVQKLIHGGVVAEEELGKIVVEREQSTGEPTKPTSTPAQRQATAQQK